MSNEIKNRSHAGLILKLSAVNAPRIVASWGFINSTLVRPTPAVGVYQIQLVEPASGIVGPDTTAEFSSLDSIILSNTTKSLPAVNAIMALSRVAGAAPAIGDRVQLPLLTILLTDAAEASVDADALIELEIRAVPQQD